MVGTGHGRSPGRSVAFRRRELSHGYYIPTRYPNGLPDSIPARVYSRKAAEGMLDMADRVLALVRQKLADR
jgi:HEPN domain-containing protein